MKLQKIALQLIVGLFLCLLILPDVHAQEKKKKDQTDSSQLPKKPRSDSRVYSLGELLIVAPVETRNLLETPTIESESLDIATATVDEEMIRLQNAATLVDSLQFSTGVFTEERGRKEKHLTSFRGQIYPYPDFAFSGILGNPFLFSGRFD